MFAPTEQAVDRKQTQAERKKDHEPIVMIFAKEPEPNDNEEQSKFEWELDIQK